MEKIVEHDGSSDDAWLLVKQLAESNQSSDDAWLLVERLEESIESSNDALIFGEEVEHCNGQSSNEESKRSEQDSACHSVSLQIKSSTGKIKECVITNTTHLQILMIRYCAEMGFVKDKMRFVFNGRLVEDLQTPDSLFMKTGNVINAMPFDTYVDEGLASNELEINFERRGGQNRITFWIKNEWDGKHPLLYSVNPKHRLKSFMDAYCDAHGRRKNEVRFMLGNKQILGPEKPNEVNMQNGALMKAYNECARY